VLAAKYVAGASYPVYLVSLFASALLAVWLWRERLQVWGWVGVALAAAAVGLLGG